MSTGGSSKAVLAALLGNLAIAIAKFAAFLVTGSSSMLAESVHSVADSGNQGLLLWGGKAARREADERHQFGFGRERYFWSFVVALVLFVVGAGFSIYEGIEKIRHPHAVTNVWVALGVLAFAIVVESYSFRMAVKESRPLKGRLSWWQFIQRSRTPELPVVLLEDFGAQVGLIFAFVAVSISHWAHAPVWDGIGTLAIGILLLVIAVILMVEMRSLLIGEGANEEDMAKIRAAIESAPDVERLVQIRTQHLGPEELLVAAEVDFSDGLLTEQLAAAIDEVERRVLAEVPYAKPMYIEPALNEYRSPRRDPGAS
jgi:cation diffusion facilitator family transporter